MKELPEQFARAIGQQPGTWAMVRLGARMMMRDARSGELHLLILALVVAVAAMTSVGFLADRVARSLESNAGQLLGADLVVDTDAPLPADYATQARRRGLAVVTTVQFSSMVSTGNATQLASLKAVEPGYPLRGSLRIADAPNAGDIPTHDIPASGTVWVDTELLALLGAQVSDTLQVGDAKMRISRIITSEPDRRMQFLNLAPRVMMRASDLPTTGLVMNGSRLSYALLVAGDPTAVSDYATWLNGNLQRGQKLVTLASGRPEMRHVLDEVQRFLSLVALLAVLISSVAIVLAACRFMRRHGEGIALMRCLGALRVHVAGMLTVEFALIGVVASAIGCLFGYVVQQGLALALADLWAGPLALPSATPALRGVLIGFYLLLGVALPPLKQLTHVPPNHLLRPLPGGLRTRSGFGYGVGALGFALLIWWSGDAIHLSAVVAAGFLGCIALFALATWGGVQALGLLRRVTEGALTLRLAVVGIVRRRGATIMQVCALAIGLMALLLLTMIRTELIAGWQRKAPAHAPNRFLINIQPDQRQAIMARLARAGLEEVTLFPMVRGRLISINDHPVSSADYEAVRAQRLVEREFNLSYATQPPPENRIEQGRWLDPSRAEVSLESSLAASLGLKLGDKLGFDVAGQTIDVTVTSMRHVDWSTLHVNFFAILSPHVLADRPQSWITSFYLPPEKTALMPALIREFSNVTMFDVTTILRQLQSVLDQAIEAVQILFLFTLTAGLLVLAAAFTATRDERMSEAALLRALGATRSQLARAQRLEFLTLGALAGLFAAAGATSIAWALSAFVTELSITPFLGSWPTGIACGMAGAWCSGALALRGVLNTPPLVILRKG
jgi:putative ABC transport system permease protein